VLFGIRPEHLVPCAPETDGAIAVEVLAVETLGADAYAHGRLPGGADEFVVRLPGSAPPRPGQRLTVRAEPGFGHLFDPDSGRRLP
jgi:sn-glycerol 3-phosphate transport system ATP-binding protein